MTVERLIYKAQALAIADGTVNRKRLRNGKMREEKLRVKRN